MIIDGRKVAWEIYEELKEKIAQIPEKLKLVVVLVGENPASLSYIKQKEKWAVHCGIDFELKKFEVSILETELLNEINKLNKDNSVTWFLVQLPLPAHIDNDKIINAIDLRKDVDGFAEENIAKLFLQKEWLYSCTPKWIKKLLDSYNIDIIGKNITIIWKSNIVGKPMALILINAWATVTVCNSKTKNLEFFTKNSDIIICATWRPGLLTADMITPGSVIIDVGTNMVDGKLTWDADFANLEADNMITPVPGWVWPMTVAMLIENTYLAYLKNRK